MALLKEVLKQLTKKSAKKKGVIKEALAQGFSIGGLSFPWDFTFNDAIKTAGAVPGGAAWMLLRSMPKPRSSSSSRSMRIRMYPLYYYLRANGSLSSVRAASNAAYRAETGSSGRWGVDYSWDRYLTPEMRQQLQQEKAADEARRRAEGPYSYDDWDTWRFF